MAPAADSDRARFTRDVPSLMGGATHTLAFYALIVVIVEAGLGLAVTLTEGFDRTLLIVGMLLVLLIVVLVAGIKFVSPPGSQSGSGAPAEITPLGSQPYPSVDEGVATAWQGRWNCHWTYRSQSGTLEPYVDDQIVLEKVDRRSAAVQGYGISAQVMANRYPISGRIESNGRYAQLIYSSPPPLVRLAGVFIVCLTASGDLDGWWLGVGSDGGDVGGGVRCVRPDKEPGFELHNYAAPGHRGLTAPHSV